MKKHFIIISSQIDTLILRQMNRNQCWMAKQTTNQATRKEFIFCYYIFHVISSTNTFYLFILYLTTTLFFQAFQQKIIWQQKFLLQKCKEMRRKRWKKKFNSISMTKMTKWKERFVLYTYYIFGESLISIYLFISPLAPTTTSCWKCCFVLVVLCIYKALFCCLLLYMIRTHNNVNIMKKLQCWLYRCNVHIYSGNTSTSWK